MYYPVGANGALPYLPLPFCFISNESRQENGPFLKSGWGSLARRPSSQRSLILIVSADGSGQLVPESRGEKSQHSVSHD